MAVALLRQLSDADAVPVRLDALGPDVHGDFRKVEIWADARRGCDSGGLQHIQNDLHGEVAGTETVSLQVVGGVYKHFVNRVIDDIFRRDVFEVHAVNLRTPLHVMGHPGRGCDIIYRKSRISLQFGIAAGGACELPPRSLPQACGVDLLDPLDHLEQPRPAGDAPGFQGGRYGEADGLLRAAQIRHHEVGGERVQAPLDALH